MYRLFIFILFLYFVQLVSGENSSIRSAAPVPEFQNGQLRASECPTKEFINDWKCAQSSDTIRDNAPEKTYCMQDDQYINVQGHSRDVYYTFTVHGKNELPEIDYHKKNAVDHYACITNILPERYTLYDAILSPPIEILSEGSDEVSITIRQPYQGFTLDSNNACIAAIVKYNNGTKPWSRCLETNFKVYTAKARTRNILHQTCTNDKKPHCTRVDNSAVVMFALMISEEEETDKEQQLAQLSGSVKLNIIFATISILSCISIFL